jgi:hypothetical protein
MRIGRNPGDTTLPFPTCLSSRNWDDWKTDYPLGRDAGPAGGDVPGEVLGAPRPWSDGFNAWGHAGNGPPLGTPEQFASGLSPYRCITVNTCLADAAAERGQASGTYSVSFTGCRILTYGPCKTAPCCFTLRPSSADGSLDGAVYHLGGNVADGFWSQLDYRPPSGGGPAVPPFPALFGPMQPYIWPDVKWQIVGTCGGVGANNYSDRVILSCSPMLGSATWSGDTVGACDPGLFPVVWVIQERLCSDVTDRADQREQAVETYLVRTGEVGAADALAGAASAHSGGEVFAGAADALAGAASAHSGGEVFAGAADALAGAASAHSGGEVFAGAADALAGAAGTVVITAEVTGTADALAGAAGTTAVTFPFVGTADALAGAASTT